MGSMTPMCTQERALQALAVALQHPAVAADQRNICTLLQVSKAWRAAVQQSAAAITNCSFETKIVVDKLSRVVHLAGWLAKHAGLLCTLELIHHQDWYFTKDGATIALTAAMQQLVDLALQMAATSSISGPGAPLRLQTYSSFLPASAGLLAALPAATLTSLDVTVDNSNWFSSLSRLTNIRQLRLELDHVAADTTNSFLRAVSKLKLLTQLQLRDIAASTDMLLLPAQLQQLTLVYNGQSHAASDSTAQVNLQHLTSLQHLQLRAAMLTAGSSIPPNLQSLELHAQWPAGDSVGIPSLHQVTTIRLANSGLSRADIEAMQHLPQLQDLSLSLQHHERLLEVAAVWNSVPLVELHILSQAIAAGDLLELMQHVAAATRLTNLLIRIHEIEDDNDGIAVEICQQLRTLEHLQGLTLNIGHPDDFVPRDTQHLSALVTLTNLELSSDGFGPCIDEATLSLLAVSLTGLRALAINQNGEDFDQRVRSITVLPVIGRLTNLEDLRLQGMNAEDAERGLQFLTDLRKLTSLQGLMMQGKQHCSTSGLPSADISKGSRGSGLLGMFVSGLWRLRIQQDCRSTPHVCGHSLGLTATLFVKLLLGRTRERAAFGLTLIG